jgi:glycerol-3-phosphate acyltransferase PlsX
MNSNDNKVIKIAIDAMGGDFAPLNEVIGGLNALKNKPYLEVIFVGDETQIKKTISEQGYSGKNYSILHASQVVTMKDDPAVAIKTKKDSSLYKGIDLVKSGAADGFISAGNTGAVMSTSTILLGRIKGVGRPTIGTFMPTVKDRPSLLLDVGASVDQKSRFLYEYAIMGAIYAEQILGINNPKVGLLSVGEEASKGTEEVKLANKILQESELNFIGNVEGRDILAGTSDIVVCDGFTGNVILKFAESFLTVLKSKIKDFSERGIFNKLKVALMVPTLKLIVKDFDYQTYGGVPLLGVNGNIIIGHGKSSPIAIENMINRAIEMTQKDLTNKLFEALNK